MTAVICVAVAVSACLGVLAGVVVSIRLLDILTKPIVKGRTT